MVKVAKWLKICNSGDATARCVPHRAHCGTDRAHRTAVHSVSHAARTVRHTEHTMLFSIKLDWKKMKIEKKFFFEMIPLLLNFFGVSHLQISKYFKMSILNAACQGGCSAHIARAQAHTEPHSAHAMPHSATRSIMVHTQCHKVPRFFAKSAFWVISCVLVFFVPVFAFLGQM